MIISRSQSAYISPANQVQSCVVGTLEDWIVIYLLGEADTQAILCQVETWTHGTRLAPENNIVLNIQYFAALPKLRLLSDDSDVGAKISNKTIRNVGSYMINMSLAETLEEERKVNIGSETEFTGLLFYHVAEPRTIVKVSLPECSDENFSGLLSVRTALCVGELVIEPKKVHLSNQR